jgi:hypothetical protein
MILLRMVCVLNFSPRRDGRVVDGGGLEKLNGQFSEFAIFPANSARYGRWGSMIESRPVAS